MTAVILKGFKNYTKKFRTRLSTDGSWLSLSGVKDLRACDHVDHVMGACMGELTGPFCTRWIERISNLRKGAHDAQEDVYPRADRRQAA